MGRGQKKKSQVSFVNSHTVPENQSVLLDKSDVN